MNWAPLETEALISVGPSEAERRGAAAGGDELGADHSFCKNKVVEEEIGLCKETGASAVRDVAVLPLQPHSCCRVLSAMAGEKDCRRGF